MYVQELLSYTYYSEQILSKLHETLIFLVHSSYNDDAHTKVMQDGSNQQSRLIANLIYAATCER